MTDVCEGTDILVDVIHVDGNWMAYCPVCDRFVETTEIVGDAEFVTIDAHPARGTVTL